MQSNVVAGLRDIPSRAFPFSLYLAYAVQLVHLNQFWPPIIRPAVLPFCIVSVLSNTRSSTCYCLPRVAGATTPYEKSKKINEPSRDCLYGVPLLDIIAVQMVEK